MAVDSRWSEEEIISDDVLAMRLANPADENEEGVDEHSRVIQMHESQVPA